MKHYLTASAPLMVSLALMGMTASGQAAEIIGGTGLGFSNMAGQWVANVIFNKDDLSSGIPTNIKTGDDLTPLKQQGFGSTLKVPATKSMAWCDPASNPANSTNTDFNQCYGWAMHSKWVVLDFNEMQKKGVKTVYLRLTAKAYDDGDHSDTDVTASNKLGDDDLVPALTVFQGRQDVGAHLDWYPNKFQTETPFWAWKLSPFTGKATNNSTGWSTAYFAQGNLDKAVVTGKLALKAGGQNYLSVAIGGDARHSNIADKHDVNFQLDVEVSKKVLSASSGSTSGGTKPTGLLDRCGCEIGVDQWHPSMNHCMAIALCEPIAGTSDQCKTPAMCERDGGR